MGKLFGEGKWSTVVDASTDLSACWAEACTSAVPRNQYNAAMAFSLHRTVWANPRWREGII